MATIFCLTGHNPQRRDEIIADVWKAMSLTEKQGFGAFWFNRKDKICYYKSQLPFIPNSKKLPSFIKKGYIESVGTDEVSDGGYLIICAKDTYSESAPKNIGPYFIGDDFAIAMAGYAWSNKYKAINASTTYNDGEIIGQAYKNVGHEELENGCVYGNYSFAVLKYFDGEPEMHIGCGNNAPLFYGRTSQKNIVISSDKKLIPLLTTRNGTEVSDKTIHIYHGYRGRKMVGIKFKPASYDVSRYHSRYDYDDEQESYFDFLRRNEEAKTPPALPAPKDSKPTDDLGKEYRLKNDGERMVVGDVIKYYTHDGSYDTCEEVLSDTAWVGTIVSERMRTQMLCSVYTKNIRVPIPEGTFPETESYAG